MQKLVSRLPKGALRVDSTQGRNEVSDEDEDDGSARPVMGLRLPKSLQDEITGMASEVHVRATLITSLRAIDLDSPKVGWLTMVAEAQPSHRDSDGKLDDANRGRPCSSNAFVTFPHDRTSLICASRHQATTQHPQGSTLCWERQRPWHAVLYMPHLLMSCPTTELPGCCTSSPHPHTVCWRPCGGGSRVVERCRC